jgi:hypothetical protein
VWQHFEAYERDRMAARLATPVGASLEAAQRCVDLVEEKTGPRRHGVGELLVEEGGTGRHGGSSVALPADSREELELLLSIG